MKWLVYHSAADGHTVVTCVHAEDWMEAVTQVMGSKPWLLSSNVIGIMACNLALEIGLTGMPLALESSR